MKAKIFAEEIINYGFNWIFIFLPLLITFLIIGPLNEVPEFFKLGNEIGFIFSSLCLSISAAGVFHFFIVYLPGRSRAKSVKKLIDQHFIFMDKVLIELIKIIDPTIDDFSMIEKNLKSFGEKVEDFDFTQKITWNSSVIGRQMGFYNKLFYSALARLDNIKDAMIFYPDEFDPLDYEKISDSIFHRNILLKDDINNATYHRCFLTILEWYTKLRENLK
jgi:hypothetical protein